MTAPLRVPRKSRPAFGLRMIRESIPGTRPATIPMRSPRDVVALMQPHADAAVAEVFWMLALDCQHHLIDAGPVVITRGTVHSALVAPREVFGPAIVMRASAIILCHNHPSGDPSPSAEDTKITTQLCAAGRLLDLPVFDHIIIGNGRYVSFAEAGLL